MLSFKQQFEFEFKQQITSINSWEAVFKKGKSNAIYDKPWELLAYE